MKAGVLTPAALLQAVEARLSSSWPKVVAGVEEWRREIALGTSDLKAARLRDEWEGPDGIHARALGLHRWADDHGVPIRDRDHSYARGSTHPIPAWVVIDDMAAAAALLGAEWPERLRRATARRDRVGSDLGDVAEMAWLLRAVDGYSDVDFDLACRAAAWFRSPHPSGLTARQVPVVGMGSKWLDQHSAVVRRLAGLDDLGLEPGRPPRVHLTYLDPTHLDAGGRRHDVATIGDVDAVAYRPRIVIVCENRDTAQQLPRIPEAIAIEGNETGAAAIGSLGWVRQAEHCFYWGDIDAAGFEILHQFRALLDVEALYMDRATYDAWESFGVDHDHQGKPIKPKRPQRVPALLAHERELYEAMCSEEWTGHRRIEQERLPLDEAAELVRRLSDRE